MFLYFVPPSSSFSSSFLGVNKRFKEFKVHVVFHPWQTLKPHSTFPSPNHALGLQVWFLNMQHKACCNFQTKRNCVPHFNKWPQERTDPSFLSILCTASIILYMPLFIFLYPIFSPAEKAPDTINLSCRTDVLALLTALVNSAHNILSETWCPEQYAEVQFPQSPTKEPFIFCFICDCKHRMSSFLYQL